jgi:hypothetical protein
MKGLLMYRVVITSLLLFAPVVSYAQGLPNVIEGYFPTQLVAGQSNVLHLGIPGRNNVTAIEIEPAAGITVKDIKKSSDVREGSLFWDVTVDVAADAAPGNRTIVAVNPMGRTRPRPIAVYAHVPTISNPKIVAAVNQPTMQLQFAMSETPNEVGDSPLVWFFLGCGGEPESGVLKGKLANGTVTVALPNPRTQLKPFAPPPNNHCDLEFRASDSKMADSNTIKTAVDFK